LSKNSNRKSRRNSLQLQPHTTQFAVKAFLFFSIEKGNTEALFEQTIFVLNYFPLFEVSGETKGEVGVIVSGSSPSGNNDEGTFTTTNSFNAERNSNFVVPASTDPRLANMKRW